ncbi:hypothetical protein GE09DRAFT_1108122 [Coniochaeta sp. 2T2.1]|nr:hypothetical protein GE09DRAFT_1108122 [Coniochaeta sp. 2T2.1]
MSSIKTASSYWAYIPPTARPRLAADAKLATVRLSLFFLNVPNLAQCFSREPTWTARNTAISLFSWVVLSAAYFVHILSFPKPPVFLITHHIFQALLTVTLLLSSTFSRSDAFMLLPLAPQLCLETGLNASLNLLLRVLLSLPAGTLPKNTHRAVINILTWTVICVFAFEWWTILAWIDTHAVEMAQAAPTRTMLTGCLGISAFVLWCQSKIPFNLLRLRDRWEVAAAGRDWEGTSNGEGSELRLPAASERGVRLLVTVLTVILTAVYTRLLSLMWAKVDLI